MKGRPKHDTPRDLIIRVRLTKEERDALHSYASACGTTMSEVLRTGAFHSMENTCNNSAETEGAFGPEDNIRIVQLTKEEALSLSIKGQRILCILKTFFDNTNCDIAFAVTSSRGPLNRDYMHFVFWFDEMTIGYFNEHASEYVFFILKEVNK